MYVLCVCTPATLASAASLRVPVKFINKDKRVMDVKTYTKKVTKVLKSNLFLSW